MSKSTRREVLRGAAAAAGITLMNDGVGSALINQIARATSGLPSVEGHSITDVAGIKVGHFTDTRRPTGCSVSVMYRVRRGLGSVAARPALARLIY